MATINGVMETLYGFGFNGSGQIQQHDNVPSIITTPTLMRRARQIKVLWASWCDVLIAIQNVDGGAWSIEYLGSGLTAAQKEHLEHSEAVKFGLENSPSRCVEFFGTKMHHGLRGFVFHHTLARMENQIVVYATDTEIDDGVSEIETIRVEGKDVIVAIEMLSGNDVLLSIRTDSTDQCKMKHFDSLTSMQQHVASTLSFTSYIQSASRLQKRIVSNSTTATAFDMDKKALTFTRDPRYPQTLGRPHDDSMCFEYIPYLSETPIWLVESGGYMTAAISQSSELFLWGQSCPQSAGELEVLGQDTVSDANAIDGSSSINLEGEQDEYIKSLTIRLDGKEAAPYQVAVGHGHLVVAARSQQSDNESKRTVFAAGDGSKGQLGFASREFVATFEEIPFLADVSVTTLAAAGWTTWVVVSGV